MRQLRAAFVFVIVIVIGGCERPSQPADEGKTDAPVRVPVPVQEPATVAEAAPEAEPVPGAEAVAAEASAAPVDSGPTEEWEWPSC